MPEGAPCTDTFACSVRDAADGVLEEPGATASGDVLYFAYGSNLCEEQVADRVGRPTAVFGGCLRNHRLLFNKRAASDTHCYANVVRVNGGLDDDGDDDDCGSSCDSVAAVISSPCRSPTASSLGSSSSPRSFLSVGMSDALPAMPDVTLGKVYKLTRAQLAAMDNFEGAPAHYSRRVLTVRVYASEADAAIFRSSVCYDNIRDRGKDYDCVVYIANREHIAPEPMPPVRRYLKRLLLGGPIMPRWYVAWLAQHPTAD